MPNFPDGFKIKPAAEAQTEPAMPPSTPPPTPTGPRPHYSWTGGLLPVLTRTDPGGLTSAIGVVFDVSMASQVVLALNIAGDEAAEREQLRADLQRSQDLVAELRRHVAARDRVIDRQGGRGGGAL